MRFELVEDYFNPNPNIKAYKVFDDEKYKGILIGDFSMRELNKMPIPIIDTSRINQLAKEWEKRNKSFTEYWLYPNSR